MMQRYYITCLLVCVQTVTDVWSCGENCLNCLGNSGKCFACQDGYYLNSDICSACPENCITCRNSTYCYACDPGVYGAMCNLNCHRCRDDMCTKQRCTSGCQDGYYEDDFPTGDIACIECKRGCLVCTDYFTCTSCPEKQYSLGGSGICHGCKASCRTCSDSVSCDTCFNGRWGNDCENVCDSCVDSMCDKNTSRCVKGCISEYTMDTNGDCVATTPKTCPTQFECGLEMFCLNGNCVACPNGCNNSDCDINNGSCKSCKDSFTGDICDIKCNDTCKTCHQFSSECRLCASGYYGTICDKSCNKNCAKTQTSEISQCLKDNGRCTDGCIDGHWGVQCTRTCNNECFISKCNRSNGHCEPCNDGFYGDSCEISCSPNCVNPKNGSDFCDQNGNCKFKCSLGFEGTKCDIALGSGNKDFLNQGKESKPIGVIAGAAGGVAFVVIVVICVVVFICIRRRNSKSENETQTFPVQHTTEANAEQGYIYAVPNKLKKTNTLKMKTETIQTSKHEPAIPLRRSHLEDQETDVDTIHVEEEIDDDEPEDPLIVNENIDPTGDTYYNVAGLKRSRINIDSLNEFVTKKTEADFDKEFQKFPRGLTRPFTESRKPENISHNRYKAIYPYDATRVVLHDGRSDYISASYIDGYNQPKAYIASLGPTKATMANFTLFWRMVWQEKVEKIVMLTNLVEGDKMKCEQYWPDVENTERYGDVIVTCDSDYIYADLSVKKFSVSKNGENRVLYHLHFTAWPDRSVPDDVTCLIEFRQKVENIKTTLGGPLIVHCSAGVGRTGTYIGLDMLTKEGKAEGSVDIFGCVMGLRGQRISMVQTMEQYRYLHDAVVHALTLDSDAVSSDTFHMADRNNLHMQFEKLSQLKEKHFNDEENAVKRNTKLKDKNRKGADIPGDLHGVVLHGRTEYINAVYINSYTTQNRYILAQTPLPGTVESFLHMILQENVTCIVTMDEENIKDKTVGVYLPAANQTLKIGSIQIKAAMCESTSSYTLRKLTITNLKENNIQEKTVYHFQMNFWKQTENSPSDTQAFVELVKDVERTANATDVTSSIIVHCLTGAERSALFCVVSILIEKMNIDNVTSVVNTVRQIRSRRTAAIPNLDQYIFCHQCVSTDLKSCNTYSNVL